MEYPTDVIIKKEKDDFQFENKEGILEVHYDVKIESCTLFGDVDWCIDNVTLLEEIGKQFHETVNDEKTRQECQLCGQHFPDSYSLFKHNLKHLKIMVVKPTIYQCNTCLICFKTKEKLKDHIFKKHTESKKPLNKPGVPKTKTPHVCFICDKVFSYKHWHSHMKEVHANSPIKCSKCGELFKCYRYLQRHKMFVHDGVKKAWRMNTKVNEKLPCDECEKLLPNRIALTTHKKNCHSTRQFQCYICKSLLKCKSYLMTHMRRVHYFDGKEHMCDICGKKFKSPRYVKIHIKNSHTNKKTKTSQNDLGS
ncbi:unnamed protein product [Parnassius mnemosyne]|uniref:C2H2-type domain-containing protein n=1 Tax=Parnassius mnemosyne TaxID=213953 RepID=A0AAV1KZ90_9NEOP